MGYELKIILIVSAVVIAGIVYYKTIWESRLQKKIVEGHNYRKDTCTFDFGKYIAEGNYVRDSNWLRQKNKGRRLKKAIILRDYDDIDTWIVDEKGL